MRRLLSMMPLVALLVLGACQGGPLAPTKADLLAKAANVKDRPGLEKALGRPDDVSKLGPIETWTYRAKDGEVKFTVAGETVLLSRTADREEKP